MKTGWGPHCEDVGGGRSGTAHKYPQCHERGRRDGRGRTHEIAQAVKKEVGPTTCDVMSPAAVKAGGKEGDRLGVGRPEVVDVACGKLGGDEVTEGNQIRRGLAKESDGGAKNAAVGTIFVEDGCKGTGHVGWAAMEAGVEGGGSPVVVRVHAGLAGGDSVTDFF